MSVKHHTGQIVIPPAKASVTVIARLLRLRIFRFFLTIRSKRPPLVDGTRITIDQAVVETVLREFIIETHPELTVGWTVEIARTADGAVATVRKP